MKYSTRHAMTLFKVSKETVRNWSQEFSEYLSPTASPAAGRHRQYTDDDLRVFALIHEMKAEGQLFEDIRASLANGQRGHVPEAETHDIIAAEPRQQLMLLQGRVLELEQEVERLRESEKVAITERALRQRAEEQLVDAQKLIGDLYKQIGRLEAEADIDDD
jgi:DNA-binding transcriptional MerR regulator